MSVPNMTSISTVNAYAPGRFPWAPAATSTPSSATAWTLDLGLPGTPAPVAPPAAVSAQSAHALTTALQQLLALAQQFMANPWPGTPAPAPTPAGKTEFVISSFNVLGSQHTAPGGQHAGMDSGVVRIRRAAQLLDKHRVEVVGFQELQTDQLREFQRVSGGKYGVYPGAQLGGEAVKTTLAWRKDTWDLVKAEHFESPFLDGRNRKMPVVRLRHKVTGQEAYFINVHNPARGEPQERWRDEGTARQIALVNRLMRETGLPVFVTGDMNERQEYFQKMTAGAPMVAANGLAGNKKWGIDWIFGSKGVTFKDFVRDRSPLARQTTDHPVLVSKARIGG